MSFRTVNGSTYSENGWRLCNRDECAVPTIPELYLVDTAPLRVGPPLTILGAWCYWYDRNVEEILTPVWGWSLNNDVLGKYGGNNGSNHLAGTAVDICAPKYPWGQKKMTADKIAKVNEGRALFSLDGTVKNSAVFWGREWSYPDEMHYQMAWREGDARNAQFAAKLLSGYLGIYKPATPVTPEAPVEKPKVFPDDWTDRELMIEILRQQRGYNLTGWDQLNGKSVVDSLSDLHRKVDKLQGGSNAV